MVESSPMRVAVGMSGGVDSSVAAALLKEQGHDVVGVAMRVWKGQEGAGSGVRHGCYGMGEASDIEDARRVAEKIGIPFHEFDLEEEYRVHVLEYFRREYLRGRTPNPCAVCNSRVKFGFLLEKIARCGLAFDRFATGHYARAEWDGWRGRVVLKKGVDARKDQSYFLALLGRGQLSRAVFPLGRLTKREVRALAGDLGLYVADKRDSQDFVSGGDYSALFAEESRPGPILDRDGRILGRHEGIVRYTVGQRRGLGLAAGIPLHVLEIDAKRNAIVVGPRQELMRRDLMAEGVNWTAVDPPARPLRAKARIRYNHREAEAEITPLGVDRAAVTFDEPQFAVTPGQAVVFYDGDVVLGGGMIA